MKVLHRRVETIGVMAEDIAHLPLAEALAMAQDYASPLSIRLLHEGRCTPRPGPGGIGTAPIRGPGMALRCRASRAGLRSLFFQAVRRR